MDSTPNSRPASVVFRGLMFTLIGVVILAISGYQAMARHQFLSIAHPAEGRVVSLNAGGSHPRIEFATDTGERITYPQGGLIFGYEQDQPVRVFYLADRPLSSAVVDDFGALWGMIALMALIGAAFVVAGLFNLLKRGHDASPRPFKGN